MFTFMVLYNTRQVIKKIVRPIHKSDIGNIGAKLNIGESVASECRYVIVMHSVSHTTMAVAVSSTSLQVLDRRPTSKVNHGYIIAKCDGQTVCVTRPTWHSCILLNFFHPWMATECRGGSKQG